MIIREKFLLALLPLTVGVNPVSGQNCASVAGSYSGTETYQSTLTFGGLSDSLDGSETIRSLTISQSKEHSGFEWARDADIGADDSPAASLPQRDRRDARAG